MTIHKRMMLSFMFMALMMLLLGSVMSYLLYSHGVTSNQSSERTLTTVNSARKAWEHFRNTKNYAGSVQLMIQPQEANEVAARFAEQYDLTLKDLNSLEQSTLSPPILKQIKQSKELAEQWKNAQLKLLTGIGLNNLPSASYINNLELALGAAIESIVAVTLDQATQQQHAAEEEISNIISKAIAILFIVSVLALVMAVLVSKSLTKPINQLDKFMTELAAGRGDLSRRMDDSGQDELGVIAKKFNQFIDSLQNMVGKTLDSVSGLHVVTDHFQEKTSSLSQNIEQQKNTIASTSETAAQLRSFTGTIVEEAQHACNVAQRVSEQADTSQNIMKQSVDNIESLTSSITTTANQVSQLAESSARISQVVSVIKEITEQTNLLALNAAIEAARAGEHGRGFAVVADEVRQLASKTQASTSDIQVIINKIQEGVIESEKSMKLNADEAQQCVEQNISVNESLALMAQSVTEINEMNVRILSATEKQQSGTNEVDKDMQQVNSFAEESNNAMIDIQSQSNELKKMARSLTDVVDGFVI